MDFCSMSFLVCFLPFFLLVYYCVPVKCRNLCILLGSVAAYGIWCTSWLWALLALIAWNYLCYRMLGRSQKKKLWIIIVIATNLVALIGSKLAEEGMPGISFLVFSVLAFQVDEWKLHKKKKKVSSLIDFGAYLSFFPKLFSGPITRYESFCKGRFIGQESKAQVLAHLEEGLTYLVIGLFYKVVLANTLAGLWQEVVTIGFDSISTALAWTAMFGFSLELYYDFQGYSMMAIGIAKMLGFELPDNFLAPYGSVTVSEFYRRWHITLGSFFRDYVYIPLGGNQTRTVGNLMVVWLLTGLWHGLSWHYLMWAAMLLVLILLERAFWGKWMQTFRFLGHCYIWLVIPLSWMLFAIPKPEDLGFFAQALFGCVGIHTRMDDFWMVAWKYIPMLVSGFALALPCYVPKKRMRTRQDQKPWVEYLIIERMKPVARAILLLLLFWVAIYQISIGTINPFMYFNF